MKKEYISPSIELLYSDMSELMAASLSSTATGNQTVTPDYNESSPDEFTSRRNVWGDVDD